ncbi:hypothetical protein F66182_8058 [Fusarium sp. NRRL 66182]|nr:hypothetical protein F66182_8058 [Fusarium sp. NRRL 66182]
MSVADDQPAVNSRAWIENWLGQIITNGQDIAIATAVTELPSTKRRFDMVTPPQSALEEDSPRKRKRREQQAGSASKPTNKVEMEDEDLEKTPSATSTKSTRRSASPVKPFTLSMLQKPVQYVEFADDAVKKLPIEIQQLYRDIKDLAVDREGFIPASFKAHLQELLPDAKKRYYSDNEQLDTDETKRELEIILEIKADAQMCRSSNASEAAWNSDVHSPLLKLALKPCKKPQLRRHVMTSTRINSIFIPPMHEGSYYDVAGSKMVDYAIALHPEESDALDIAIRRILQYSPAATHYFNHAAYDPIRFAPTAVSIETTTGANGLQEARLQLGIWIASWSFRLHQLLETRQTRHGDGDGRAGAGSPQTLIPLPVIIVVEHDWKLLFACDRGNRISDRPCLPPSSIYDVAYFCSGYPKFTIMAQWGTRRVSTALSYGLCTPVHSMPLSKEDLQIISERPLGAVLDPFRDKLRNNDTNNEPQQEDVASLLSALVGSTAAFSLASPDRRGNVAVKLFAIQQQVRGGSIDLGQFRPLIRHVIASSDVDIWEAVYTIIENSRDITPPSSSIAATFNGTPVKSNSSRLADTETRDIVEKELFFEIRDCTFRNVGGFIDKFFNPEGWGEAQKAMLKAVMAEHSGKTWAGFPTVPDEKPVWDWLQSLEESCLPDASYKLQTTKTASQFKERKGQMDLFFQRPAKKPSSTPTYKDILVIGEHKKSFDKGRFKEDFLQLTRYVRGVFTDQPTRRYVHGFLLCASMMELWIFDRSGPYSSGIFDIHQEPDKFARALVGYATMDDATMGLDTFIDRKHGHHCVTLNDANDREMSMRLARPIVRQKAVVCRGTTCFDTRGGNVAKFSWVSDKRKLEVEQLKLAEQRGVQGVARVVAHRQITTIAEIREGLDFRERHRFRNETAQLDGLPSTSSGDKRKSSSDHSSESASGSKRLRPSTQKPKLLQMTGQSLSNLIRPSLYTSGEDLWDNRIYSCLVISPAGRVISDFRTIEELLRAMRDAIKAHQSLYTVGNILHRDISSNNIIITKPELADGFEGMLIDLDLAKERDSGPSGARHQTGTMQFMAVEVLRRVDHTYRHDLESFFYVLLWMCARQSWRNGFANQEKPPQESRLRKWEGGRFQDIADAKRGHMTVDGLEDIMGEFPKSLAGVKPLCLKIRKILFPLDKDERTIFGTPAGDPNQLYRPVLAAFDEAIHSLE